MDQIKLVMNRLPGGTEQYMDLMSDTEVKKAGEFHQSFKEYDVTPLTSLEKMAEYLGLKSVFIKDESYRFGLNAFKVLGGSFAIAKYIAAYLKKDVSDLPYDVLTSEELKKSLPEFTFFTATDGNHGRGVAWSANRLQQKCVVYMPKGTTQNRLQHILDENAKATIEEVNYDECVRMAAKSATEVSHGVVIQDTAWEGYEEIPSWIMQGYGTMALEAARQLKEQGCEKPTHIIVQAGVGSLAGAVAGYFCNLYKENPPKIIVVEAKEAACLYEGAVAGDGKPRIVDGDMPTIMAGLACGEPNTISWEILKNHVTAFASCPDWVAVKGMRMLGAPIKGDKPITSGESGAAPFGFLVSVMIMDEYVNFREELGLNQDSRVLVFSTEGDTDPDRYKNIVWEGLDR